MTEKIKTTGNTNGIAFTKALQTRDFEGLAFVNLVDFDMLYGHRRDVAGYAAAATEFDKFVADFIPGMREGDILMVTADHGCDPPTPRPPTIPASMCRISSAARASNRR